ncbi:serine hydrolase [Conexibacter sp. W3-3-2]|uniref:serine hydrolase domain-containing protein n=1 Tax=Conexibacter sp. W3-3-2 TaxID=2675227 RepID=UPI0012B9C706|nr:serine hydrolase domain-containing protein [Conexibacter sp. W3-3-2]MTD45817.1 serine hydrolase [Conexibacter sp. W3-3-2]
MTIAVACALAVGPGTATATPASASAAASAAASADAARAVAAQVPGARLRAAGGPIDPTVALPGVADVLRGRADVMLDPAFWVATVSNLLESGSLILPTPVDAVRPEAFLPTAPVAASGTPWALPRETVDLGDLRYEWRGRRKSLRDFLRTTETDIVAFVHRGRIVTDAYANGWSAEVRHQPWSATKSVISAVVGIALDEGRVRSLDDPIERYVPQLRGSAWEGTTIENLLQMESGVHWDEDTPVLALNTQVQQWIQAALDLVTDGRLGQGRNAFLRSLPRVAPQGTRFSYNSGNTQVLAWMTEEVYGKPFNEVLGEKLWRPAGMAGDARILTDRAGDAIASQGLYARVFDLARFGELFRRGGRTPEGRQVVPESWTRTSTRMTDLSRGRYALQWWAGPTPDSYQASGFQGQKISVSPAHCLTGVRLSHAFGLDSRPGDGPPTDPDAYGFGTEFAAEEWNALYRAVAARLGTCPPATAPAGPPGRAATVRLGRTAVASRAAALRRGALALRVGVTGRRMEVRILVSAAGRRGGPRRTVAARRLVLRPGPARVVSVPLTAQGRRLLRATRRVPVLVRATGDGDDRPGARRRVVVR